MFDGTNTTGALFVNGQEVPSTPCSYSAPPALPKEDEPLNAGFASTLRFNAGFPIGGVVQRLDGIMDEVRMYDRPLSAQEIGDYYANHASTP